MTSRSRAPRALLVTDPGAVATGLPERIAVQMAQFDGVRIEPTDASMQAAIDWASGGPGFGNAGVHIPQARARPIAGQVRDFQPVGYPPGQAPISHGMERVADRTGVVRFTFDTAPARRPVTEDDLAGIFRRSMPQW